MIKNFEPVNRYCIKFYQHENAYKSFLETTEEELAMISKYVYKIQEKTKINKISELERYQKTLEYLTNPSIRLDLETFDKRIAFLIMMVDPNLITYNEFLKINLISISEIENTKDEVKRNYLKEIRKQALIEYTNNVREKVGFFDIKLLKYEEVFFKKFLSKKETITKIRHNNLNNTIQKVKKR